MGRIVLFLCVFASCVRPTSPSDDTTDTTEIALLDPPAAFTCGHTLAITPTTASGERGATVRFTASGGSGSYRFTLISGAPISMDEGVVALSAAHLASEIVRVEDTLCGTTKDAALTVYPRLEVRPESLTVAPSRAVKLVTSGGSGAFTYAVRTNGSSGSLQASTFTTGTTQATDELVVTDTITGAKRSVMLKVENGASYGVGPSRAVLPLGSSLTLRAQNTSGALTLTASPLGLVQIDGLRLSGLAAGTTQLAVKDEALNETITIPVTVAASLDAPLTRSNDASASGFELADVANAGDLDGDGREEVIVAEAGLNLTGHRSGGVHVYYPNGSGGFAVDTFAGATREVEAGAAMLVADLDGDGRKDLLIGAPMQTSLAAQDGAVYVHKGEASGHFSTSRTIIAGGRFAARLGTSLVACDFNGDGRLDWASGGPYDQNPALASPATYQGSVAVFFGKPNTIATQPDQTLFGRIPSGASFADTALLRLGQLVAAGDFDGDGFCDLAATSSYHDANRGLVAIYRGSAGGLSLNPVRMLQGEMTGHYFGWDLRAADLDADGKAELVIGAFSASKVYIVPGAAFPTPPITIESAASVAWQTSGAPGEAFGVRFTIADVDRDGHRDLLVGAIAATVPSLAAAGELRLYLGRSGLLPNPVVARRYYGNEASASFGFGVAVANVDGAGDPEIISFAPYHSSLGPRAGRPFVLASANLSPITAMPYPGDASGQELGAALAITEDLTGDGIEDLAASAPLAESQRGAVYLYAGTSTGFQKDPTITLPTTGSQFGKDLVYAGAFSTTTRRHLAVVAMFAPRQTNAAFLADSNYVLEANCSAPPVTGYDVQPYNQGSVALYGADPGQPLSTTPDFIYFGGNDGGEGAQMWRVTSGFDWNGDGKDDLAVSSARGNGYVAVILAGRTRTVGKTTVICNPDAFVRDVFPANMYGFGYALAGLGDLWPADATLHGALAVGSLAQQIEVPPYSLQRGAVFVLRRPASGSGEPEVTLLSGERAGGHIGEAIARVHTPTLSPLPALAITASLYERGNVGEGRIFLAPGERIAASTWRAFSALPKNASMYTGFDLAIESLSGASGFGRLDLWSPTPVAGWGTSLGFLPGTPPLLAIGIPSGMVSGRPSTGGVYVHALATLAPYAPGIVVPAHTEIAGEDLPSGSQLGTRVAAGTLQGKRVLVFSATHGYGAAPDAGSIYSVVLE